MSYNVNDVGTWPGFKPPVIAHDVGRSHDRSTAVVGGIAPYGQQLLGIAEAEELPQNLFGHRRANALAAVDARHHGNALIVADLSNDATYAEILYETFGSRVIGLQIGRFGDGMTHQWRPVKGGGLHVYNIGRTYLIELFLKEFRSSQVRMIDTPGVRRAFDQLASLETEFRDSGTVYSCPTGQHDDLGISCAMLAWAARHPHLQIWIRNFPASRPRQARKSFGWESFT
jgi:hypothetical protein